MDLNLRINKIGSFRFVNQLPIKTRVRNVVNMRPRLCQSKFQKTHTFEFNSEMDAFELEVGVLPLNVKCWCCCCCSF